VFKYNILFASMACSDVIWCF